MAANPPKVPKPSDPQLVRRSQNSAREAWRMFEIIAEFVTATERLQTIQPAVAVFGSARATPGHRYYELAEDIARRLSEAGFSVISGGGPGIMEAANRGAYEGRSPSVGLNIQLPHEQVANAYQDVSHTFQHFFARKVMFVKLSCAFVMMPGGFGTLDELMEVLTLVQTGKIRKVPVILVGSAFWSGLLQWIKGTLREEGMIGVEDPDLLQVIDDPQSVVEAIFAHYQSRGFEPSPSEREAELAL
ncbi:MAG TPA: TIGR00730 family Rossman fold protein [Usitatibacter sp.]|nr:TIGR00730 family Rossman fold protein [Usitatibacter sp.]